MLMLDSVTPPFSVLCRWSTIISLAAAVILLSCGGSLQSRNNSGGPSPGSCDFQAGGSCTLIAGGVTRQYQLFIPSSYKTGNALVIALHPATGTGAQFEASSQLDSEASQHGFAIAYPTALLGSQAHTVWNGYFSASAFSGTPPDDVGFIRALINNLQFNLHPDPKHIYVTGFSLGSLMTERVGVEISDLVAAIAPYEYNLYGYGAGTANTTVPRTIAPISVLVIDGSHTGLPNICGYQLNGNVLASIDNDMSYWSGPNANSCSSFDTTASFCTGAFDPVTGEGIQTTLTEKYATSCGQGTVVQAYKLMGGQHGWYGSTIFTNTNCSAASSPPCNTSFNHSTGMNLNDIIWNFFAAHPKP